IEKADHVTAGGQTIEKFGRRTCYCAQMSIAGIEPAPDARRMELPATRFRERLAQKRFARPRRAFEDTEANPRYRKGSPRHGLQILRHAVGPVADLSDEREFV